jgi:integrase
VVQQRGELYCLHRMMILGQRQTPPKALHVLHFPRLAEDNVREGFCEHDSYLLIRGAAPYHIQVAVTIGYYTGMRKAEILGPRWDNQMDMDQNCIRLERKQTKDENTTCCIHDKAKELRDRHYPYCPWVVHINRKRLQTR